MRVHHNSAKHLRCTATLSRRAPWGDRRHINNRAGNVNTRIRAGRTGTSQCSPYQIELCGNGKVGTDNCDHERHVGTNKNTRLRTKQPSKAKKKVLLLELREQFHSREQKLISKESGTSRRSLLQKNMGVSEKEREWRLGAIDNKIKISNPKISLINHIDTPPNPTSTNML